jgi:hypothetical protein
MRDFKMSKDRLNNIVSKKISIKDIRNKTHKSGLMNFDVDAEFDYINFNLELDLNKKAISLFAANGIGKSSIYKHLEFFLFHKKYNMDDVLLSPNIIYDKDGNEEANLNFYGYCGDIGVGFFDNDKNIFLNLNAILESQKEFLLPMYGIHTLERYSFFSFFAQHQYQKTSLEGKMMFFEKNHGVSSSSFTNTFYELCNFSYKKGIFIKGRGYAFPPNGGNPSLYALAYIVELISSLTKINLNKFIKLLISDDEIIINNKQKLRIDSILLTLEEIRKNKELLNFLLQVYNEKVPTIFINKFQDEVRQYNNNIRTNFGSSLNIFNKYFSGKFLNITLKELYNPCFDF